MAFQVSGYIQRHFIRDWLDREWEALCPQSTKHGAIDLFRSAFALAVVCRTTRFTDAQDVSMMCGIWCTGNPGQLPSPVYD
jgi:hypothetical protein